ncbi:hypothetical protein WSM22_18040 [Cytophagales bacterium WSM2-2]|nr:hypothetical protein WSM22_18040 [Cytophagales bacterium WSM2-2]
MFKWKKYNTEDNAVLVTLKLLELLKVPFTSKFSREIRLHPEFPNLLSISNALHELNVANIAVKISPDQLSEMSFPAISQVHANNGSFIIILKIENGLVQYLDSNLANAQTTVDDFAKHWTGYLLLAETNEKSGEPNYIENRKLEILSRIRYAALAILLIIAVSVLLFLKPASAFPVLLNVLGVGLCIALLMQTFGQKSLLSEAVCKPNSKIDCNQVINSSVAKVYGDISLAEIGLLFFAGGLLTNLLLALNSYSVFNPYLYFLYMLSVPFTIFSIYYQWRVVKSWCAICLGVVGLLWAGAIYYWSGYSSLNFNSGELAPVAIGYLLPLAVWFVVRSSVFQAQSVSSVQRSLYRFSKNQNVFDTLIQRQRQLGEDFGNGVTLGNAEARHTITLVTSPTCRPCINAHQAVESWLHQFEENIKVVIQFAVNPVDNGSIPNTIARNIISLSLNGDHKTMKEAMRTWYNPKRPELKEWLSLLPVELHPGTEAHFNNHYDWFEKSEISAVPAIFFDGKQIPNEYSFEDFENILRLKLSADN